MRSFFAFILFGVLFLPGALRAQQSKASDAAIARAGNVFISEQEFLERYELLPGFGRHRKNQQETKKLELLYSMIAEKLLAQDAESRGLRDDPAIRSGVEGIRKLLGRDELYREEIVRKVTVRPEEIELGITRSQFQVLARYIYFEREADARFVRSQMKQKKDFDRLQIDSSYHAERDTATVIWGEADENIETAAYALRSGDISPAVRAGGGAYIMTLVSTRRNDFYANMTPEVQRERVAATLRQRRERHRLDEFLAEFLRDKTGFGRPEPMRVLARSIDAAYHDGASDTAVFLTPERVARVTALCQPILRDTIAVAGGRSFSVEEVIDILRGKAFGIRRDALRLIPHKLNTEIQVIVQQELLGQEAIARKLDQVPEVRRRIEMWTQSMLAGSVKDSLQRVALASDAEAWALLKSRDTLLVVPQVQIRELLTANAVEMQAALEELNGGASLASVVGRWSSDPAGRTREGLTAFFPVTQRFPIGEIASKMEPGQRYGPMRVRGGEFFFELVAKKNLPDSADTSMANRFAAVKEEMRSMKARRGVTLSIQRQAKTRGFDIYADRLKMLEVSPSPMMTFRILGFGGRMLAVPFVDPQLDWLEDEEPETKVMP